MPKHKTKKSVLKRFRRTGTGKLLRMNGGKSHLATSKSRKRKRQLRKPSLVPAPFATKLSALMGG
ncbi:MAG: 50S ribosomal protein L35 [Kiritimatiellae bacterium]|nr:50S ribosomal protein L35 [Kiritimatiellia bacterium]MDW8457754.1 50S ribosomal protein L35 [Verrucomicrobiota bacterium]